MCMCYILGIAETSQQFQIQSTFPDMSAVCIDFYDII